MYLIHFNSNHDPKTGRFAPNPNSMRSKQKNYLDVMDSLTPDEYKLFADGGIYNKSEESKWIKKYSKWQQNHQDTRVFISKYGNVTLASLEIDGAGDKEWNIGWATNPNSRGTGITQANAKEAISLIRSMSNVPIVAVIEKDNIPSQKTAEKAGFEDAGLTRMNDGSVRKRYVYKD